MASYYCSGCTALYDAVCTAIDELGKKFAAIDENNRPAHVLIAIMTDGLKNASRKFTIRDVQKRIDEQQTKYSWEFVYLASNLEALYAGKDLGIHQEDIYRYEANPEGVRFAQRTMNERINRARKQII